MLKDWIPFLQSLIWPVFISFLLLWNRAWFKELLATIKTRVEEGSELSIGPSGLSVGQAPALPDEVAETDMIDDGFESDEANEESVNVESLLVDDYSNLVSLNHTTSYWKMKNGRAYYRMYVNTLSDSSEVKSKIEKVVYMLHPTFKKRIRVITDASSDFLLTTNGWGEFVIKAEVYFNDGHPPVKLNRYIDIKA